MERNDVQFLSGRDHCVGWLYWPSTVTSDRTVPCVVMAHGFSLTRMMDCLTSRNDWPKRDTQFCCSITDIWATPPANRGSESGSPRNSKTGATPSHSLGRSGASIQTASYCGDIHSPADTLPLSPLRITGSQLP